MRPELLKSMKNYLTTEISGRIFCTTEIGIFTPCLQNHYDFFLWKVNLQKELNLTKQNQPDRNEILFLAK